MEGDKLEVDAPLRSLRRFPAGSAADGSLEPKPQPAAQLPFYTSDLMSRPVREPGSVPFFWEQKPGEPRNGCSGGGGRLAAAAAPKPPPGGISEEPSGEQASVLAWSTKPGSSVRRRKAAAFGSVAGAGESSEFYREVGVEKENGQQPIGTVGEDEAEDDDDDAFSDALDTLSRTESILMNCSVSGLSGVPDSAKTPSRGAADLQVRDFMMGRFLPAAQAMVSAPPQYASRKPSVLAQEPTGRPSDRAAKEGCRKPSPSPIQRRPDSALQHVQKPKVHDHYSENDVEDEDDDDGSVHWTSKGCGFLPHLCAKASVSLLNSVPGMKNVGRLPSPSRRRTTGGLQKPSGQTKAEGSKHDGRSRLRSGFNQLAHCKEVSSSYPDESSHSPPREGGRDFVRVRNKISKIDEEGYWVITPDHEGQLVSDLLRPAMERQLDIDPIPVSAIAESLSSSFSTIPDSADVIQNQSTEVSQEALQRNDVSQSPEPHDALQPKNAKLDGGEEDLSEKVNSIDTRNLESNCWWKKTADPLRQPILPLPLPKSPSDSWLSRTLPSVASKHPAPQLMQGVRCRPRKQFQMSLVEPKQDASVKTSKVQLRQVRFVEILAKPESPKSEI